MPVKKEKTPSKISLFLSYLNEGMTREEAMKKADISKSTSRTQYYKWKKSKEGTEEIGTD